MPIVIVRHAHAGSRSAWVGDDQERPLSAKGVAQAEGLVPWLTSQVQPTRLLSSPYLRCLETLGPLRRATGLDVEPRPVLGEGQGAEAVALVGRLPGFVRAQGPAAVLCTHGDVAVDLFAAFGTAASPDIRSTLQKGGLWVLAEVDGTLDITGYRPPPVAAPE